MIKTLSIRNFKSIRSLDLECSRINVFIGEPNTGKSNILEAIGFLSYLGHGGNIHDFIRFETMPNIFFNMILENDVEVKLDDKQIILTFRNGRFIAGSPGREPIFGSDYLGSGTLSPQGWLKKLKFYRFRSLRSFTDRPSEFLLPPSGSNLLALILTNPRIRSVLADLLAKFGWKLVAKPHEGKVELQKELDGVVISLPYFILSDTIQRLIFHLAAVLSNRDSVIVFEEPEAHAFPYYTRYLAELIALDRNGNQYFISTHNPYFLTSIIEKSPMEEISVFITYSRDGETKVKPFTSTGLEKLLEYDVDVFLNIGSLIGE
ncbi:MAG: hypothetical protein DRN49_06850 [Thaumarchaeota archaeon]|nr:MAG: hypothetical protein DRN49_06850 [Nitrososphaerota archaeon]